jgi:hypothetical protein
VRSVELLQLLALVLLLLEQQRALELVQVQALVQVLQPQVLKEYLLVL